MTEADSKFECGYFRAAIGLEESNMNNVSAGPIRRLYNVFLFGSYYGHAWGATEYEAIRSITDPNDEDMCAFTARAGQNLLGII